MESNHDVQIPDPYRKEYRDAWLLIVKSLFETSDVNVAIDELGKAGTLCQRVTAYCVYACVWDRLDILRQLIKRVKDKRNKQLLIQALNKTLDDHAGVLDKLLNGDLSGCIEQSKKHYFYVVGAIQHARDNLKGNSQSIPDEKVMSVTDLHRKFDKSQNESRKQFVIGITVGVLGTFASLAGLYIAIA